MNIDFRRYTYIPTLFVRQAELRALSELPNKDKDDLLPIIPIRPWLASNELSRTIERIDMAFEKRPYIIDLDHFYKVQEISRPAQAHFQTLLSADQGFENWFDFVAEIPFAVPCLRLETRYKENLESQIERATELDRGFVARFIFGHTQSWPDLARSICETGHSNFAIVVDTCWSRDLLSREAWASQLISFITGIRPEIPIIVTGSSFPSSFTKYKSGDAVTLQEQQLFLNLTRQHNAAWLIYGDWASSREPSEQKGGTIVPRIDIPLNGRWLIFRAGDESDGYKDVAGEALKSKNWNHDVNVWGSYMIKSTAEGQPYGVSSPVSATAARINMHLHSQLRKNQPQMLMDTEEEYEE